MAPCPRRHSNIPVSLRNPANRGSRRSPASLGNGPANRGSRRSLGNGPANRGSRQDNGRPNRA